MAPSSSIKELRDSLRCLALKVDVGRIAKKKKQKKKWTEEELFGYRKSEIVNPNPPWMVEKQEHCLRQCLPLNHVLIFKELIVHSFRDCQVLILLAASSSMKSLCLPYILAEADSAIADPKASIACASTYSPALDEIVDRFFLSTTEVGIPPGNGCYANEGEVRIHDRSLKPMTVDLLLQHITQDPNLSSFSLVLIDDAHHRTLAIDLLLGLLLPLLQRRRTNLRLALVVPPSAGHQAAKFEAFFGRHCSTKTCDLSVKPLVSPLISHMTIDDADNPLRAALAAALDIHRRDPAASGNIVFFLGGVSGVEDVCRYFRSQIAKFTNPIDKSLFVFPMYMGTPTEHVEIFQATQATRCDASPRRILYVLSPDVPDDWPPFLHVNYAIDLGLRKHGERISQQSAHDRTSFLGAVRPRRPPRCIRLYSKRVFEHEMLPTNVPQILSCSVEELQDVLSLMKQQLGIADPKTFHFIDSPHTETLASAMQMLE